MLPSPNKVKVPLREELTDPPALLETLSTACEQQHIEEHGLKCNAAFVKKKMLFEVLEVKKREESSLKMLLGTKKWGTLV